MANSHPASGSRSIIDELNVLRERRPASNAMDELRHTLTELEKRLSLMSTPPESHRYQQPDYYHNSVREPAELPAYSQPRSATVMESAALRQIDHRLNEISRALIAANRYRETSREDTGRLDRIEKRLTELTGQLDTSLAEQNSDILFRRLGELSQRIDTLNGASNLPQQVIEPLARQINLLAQHLGKLIDNPHSSDYRSIDARLATIAGKLAAMEKRASEPNPAIVDKLNERFAALAERLDAQYASHHIGQETIHNLESQLATIAQHLVQPSVEFAELKPRLDNIERSLSSNREAVFDAAREAAESAVARLSEHGSQNDSAMALQLSNDIKSLESLARTAEERNGKSFQSVHEALVKVVDRLTHLEQNMNGDGESPAASNPFSVAPQPVVVRTPVAAQKKSKTDIASPLLEEKLGHLTPKIRREPELNPTLDSTQPDNDGALDLSTIMRRVREERSQQEAGKDQPGGKADFISVARRTAQQAADESKQIEEKLAEGTEDRKSSLGGFFHRQRKPILMGVGAVMIAIAGLQVGSAFLQHDEQADPASQHAELPAIDPATTASVHAPALTPDNEPVAPATVEMQELPQMPETITPATQITEPRAESVLAAPSPAAEQAGQNAAITDIPQETGPEALRDAASKGDTRALFEIGNRYMEGRGVTADFAQAAKWYERAAEQNYAPAQYRLGNFNEKGLGMPRDLAKAKDWYQLAAGQGNASAMHNLAVLYASGANGAPDNAAAVRWFTEAAELGVRDSQFNLGILAAKGLGMAVDLEESYKWFALAANSGDKDSAQKRDQVAAILKPAQLKRAKGAVELWKAKPLNEAANSIDVPEGWSEDAPVATSSVDMKKAVRNIQLILQKNGYDVGAADGVMGSRTRNAIAAIQKANGQNPTGEVDQQLVQLLLEKNG
ncbi:SEL1-like repeat protein [Falsochrobactrum sp. TDYN1]|uniref:SEL1-like repeat protein n=1 Tax=Falsochrobactrum tianjinense TaxID=2706015 RepID=A0A949PLU0_9HYPH|nr:SEL1-like repeat protein [Falsochrobactrum sp. TDYN1]MBV2142982.1 SEL1-like repeat protein [Falsochrobactrum sp. TDYN1]